MTKTGGGGHRAHNLESPRCAYFHDSIILNWMPIHMGHLQRLHYLSRDDRCEDYLHVTQHGTHVKKVPGPKC